MKKIAVCLLVVAFGAVTVSTSTSHLTKTSAPRYLVDGVAPTPPPIPMTGSVYLADGVAPTPPPIPMKSGSGLRA